MSYSKTLREFIMKGCMLCENPTDNVITLKGLSNKAFVELHIQLLPFITEEDNSSFIANYMGSKIMLIKHG